MRDRLSAHGRLFIVTLVVTAPVVVVAAGAGPSATAAAAETDGIPDDDQGLMLWSRDNDTADNATHLIYEYYDDEETEVGRSGDIRHDVPQSSPRNWTGTAWSRYGSGATYDWRTSVTSGASVTTGGKFIKDAHVSFFDTHPATKIHTEEGVYTRVSSNGQARLFTDFLVEVPRTFTDNNPPGNRIVYKKIEWRYNKSKIHAVELSSATEEDASVDEATRIGKEQRECPGSTAGCSRYTFGYSLDSGVETLVAESHMNATLRRKTTTHRCFHENESKPSDAEVVSESSSECASNIDPGVKNGVVQDDSPSAYSVLKLIDIDYPEDRVTATARYPVEVSTLSSSDARVTVGEPVDIGIRADPAEDQLILEDTTSAGRSFASYAVGRWSEGKADVDYIERRWQFYTATNPEWNTVTVRQVRGSSSSSTAYMPMYNHAFASETEPSMQRTGNLRSSVVNYWGPDANPPAGISENVDVGAATETAEEGRGIHSRHGWDNSSSSNRTQEIRLYGFVDGETTTVPKGEWTMREVRPSNLTMTTAENGGNWTTLTVRLEDQNGNPIQLSSDVTTLSRFAAIDRLVPITALGRYTRPAATESLEARDHGYVVIESEYESKRVYPGADGTANVTFNTTGLFSARYVPHTADIVSPAYRSDSAAARSSPFASVFDTLGTILWLVLGLAPVWVAYRLAGKTDRLFKPFRGQQR